MLDQVVTVDATVGSGQTNDGDFVSSLSTSLSSTSLSSTSLSSESLSSASVSLPPDSLPPVSLVSAGVPMAVVPLNGDRRYVGHFRRSIVPLFCVWGFGFLVLAASAAQGHVRELFLDPSYANGGAWWTGLVSQLGILGWTTAVASAAWAAWIARHTGRRAAAQFLYRGALASVVLLVDDLVGVHSMFWALGPLGKPFGLTLVLSPVAAWFWVYRSDIRRTRWVLLAGAFVANALSIVADTLGHGSVSNLSALLEDGPKFLGILAWATYFVASTYDIARSALRAATRDHAGPSVESSV
jgi:hypothetical protein